MTKAYDFDIYSRTTPKISIIVPVYNAEKYLSVCIDSILIQTLTDFELLLIDDGSNDHSGAICDEYATKDRRVRVFHKENGGVSSARNLGIDNAEGEWVAFVDSDDCIAPNFCDTLINKGDEDLIVGSFAEFGNINKRYILKSQCLSKTDFALAMNEYLANIHFTTVWGKLFKKSILNSEKLRFHLNIDSTEDTLFVYTYLLYVSSIGVRSDIVYFYRYTGEGLSCQNVSIDKTICTIKEMYNIITALDKSYKTTLSLQLFNIVDYIYLRSIRFIQNNSVNIFQRVNLIKKLHTQLPSFFLKEYTPSLMGARGKIFYMLARKECYWLLSIYSYFVSL